MATQLQGAEPEVVTANGDPRLEVEPMLAESKRDRLLAALRRYRRWRLDVGRKY